MPVRYPLVLLDADDTLFDYPAGEAAALEALFFEYGLPYDPLGHLPLYQRHNIQVWQEYEQGLMTQETLGWERFRRVLEELEGGDPGMAVRMGESYLVHLSDSSQLFPGAHDACRILSEGCTLVIVTNGIGFVQHKRIKASPLAELVRKVIVSEEVGCRKPLPGIFHHAILGSGLAPIDNYRVLMVGDSLKMDIAGAAAAGIHSCWYNPKGLKNDTPNIPNHEIRTLEDLLPLVLGMEG